MRSLMAIGVIAAGGLAASGAAGVDVPWSLSQTYTPEDASDDALLGASRLLLQDGMLIAGAPGHDNGDLAPGAVFVFDTVTGEQLHRITSDRLPGDTEFGRSLALRDGELHVAYSFREALPLSPRAIVEVYDLESGDRVGMSFPSSSALVREFGAGFDVNAEHRVVGAPESTLNGPGTGSAHVSSSTSSSVLFPPDPDLLDRFGSVVSIDGDTLYVAARGDDDFGPDTGAVYAFDLPTRTFLRKHRPDAEGYRDHFGTSVSASGGVVAIGSPGVSYGGHAAAAVYLFDIATGARLHKLSPPGPAAGNRFGASVYTDGEWVFVLSSGESGREPGSNAIYIFDVATGDLLQRLAHPTGDYEPLFSLGGGVMRDGDTVYISSVREPVGEETPGVIFAYDVAVAGTAAVYGDFNGDCVVNVDDLASFLAAWGQPGLGDFNRDGDTDAADLAALLSWWE